MMKKGIELHENIFCDISIKKPDKYVKKLKSGRIIKGFFVVAFCDDNKNPEIFSAYNFIQKFFREQYYTIIGIFKSEDSAFEYIRALSDISIRKFNQIDFYTTVEKMDEADFSYIASCFAEDKE